jgi:phage shock protein C
MSSEYRKLYRSRDDRIISGVCGGLGEFFGIDPTLIRIIFILLLIFGGSGLIIYLVMWLIVPDEPLAAVSQAPKAEAVEPEPSAENESEPEASE